MNMANGRIFDALPPHIQAVRAGDIELVRRLIAQGADVNFKTKGDGYTALHAAFHGDSSPPNKRAEMVRLLVENGADMNAEGGFCLTPFFLAISSAKRGDLELALLQYLIDHGADVNKVLECVDENESRTTAIGMAVEQIYFSSTSSIFTDEKILQLLIDNGADPSVDPHACFTPLRDAIEIKKKLGKELQPKAYLDANKRMIAVLKKHGSKTS